MEQETLLINFLVQESGWGRQQAGDRAAPTGGGVGKRTRGIFYLTLSIRGTNIFCINALVDCIAAGKIKKVLRETNWKEGKKDEIES